MRLFREIALKSGVCVPFLYFGTVVVASLFVSGYSHMRQGVSELGMAAVPHPAIFNTGALAAGICALAASGGLCLTLGEMGINRLTVAYITVAVAMLGIAESETAIFPAPHPWHFMAGLWYPIAFAPLAAATLYSDSRLRKLAAYSAIVFAGVVAITPVFLARHSLVMRPYGGLLQRVISLLIFPWVGVLAYVLLSCVRKAGHEEVSQRRISHLRTRFELSMNTTKR